MMIGKRADNSTKIATRTQEWQVLSPCCDCGYSVQEHERDGRPNGWKSGEGKDAKPPSYAKMGMNSKNPTLTKNAKKVKEWCQTLSAGCNNLWSNICPIVAVKSLDSSINHKIQVEIDLHVDTTVVGSNVLVVHDHERYIDVYGYDSKSWHKNITNVDAAVA